MNRGINHIGRLALLFASLAAGDGTALARPSSGPDEAGDRRPPRVSPPAAKPPAAPAAPRSRAYTLTPQSIAKLEELKQFMHDGEQGIKLANALLLAAPFVTLLDKPDPVTAYEIAETDWALIASASAGLRAGFRHQVRLFCVSAALSIPKDSGFWTRLAEQLYTARSPNSEIAPSSSGSTVAVAPKRPSKDDPGREGTSWHPTRPAGGVSMPEKPAAPEKAAAGAKASGDAGAGKPSTGAKSGSEGSKGKDGGSSKAKVPLA